MLLHERGDRKSTDKTGVWIIQWRRREVWKWGIIGEGLWRPKEPQPASPRAKAGVDFLRRESEPLSHQLGGLGSAVSSPAGFEGTVFLYSKSSRWSFLLHYRIICARSSAWKWGDYPQIYKRGSISQPPFPWLRRLRNYPQSPGLWYKVWQCNFKYCSNVQRNVQWLK